MEAELLAALAEPNRLRIVELLNEAPRAVGEIAQTLGLRQPQVTKHLQTLQRAGLVTMHPLGQRRIYALRRQSLRELGAWLEGFAADAQSESVLERYQAAIDAEQRRAARDPAWAAGRSFRLQRTVAARPEAVWARWTRPELMRRWWSPEHFSVVECVAEPVPGGALRIVMQEGDGTRHVAAGRYVELAPPRTLSFELAPLDPDAAPLFAALHRVGLVPRRGRTTVMLAIRVRAVAPGAVPALAGMRIGWGQLLDKLAADAARDSSCRA